MCYFKIKSSAEPPLFWDVCVSFDKQNSRIVTAKLQLLEHTEGSDFCYGREAIHTYPFVFLPLLADLVSAGCLSSLCIKGNTVNSRSRM